MNPLACAHLLFWRECVGIEPTADSPCPPPDLKSGRATRPNPPPRSLDYSMDFGAGQDKAISGVTGRGH